MQGTPRPVARADPCIDGGPDDGGHSIARDPVASVKGRTAYRSSPENRKTCALCARLHKSLCVPTARIAIAMTGFRGRGACRLAAHLPTPLPIPPPPSPPLLGRR